MFGMKQLFVLLCCITCLTFSSCYDGAPKADINIEASGDVEVTSAEIIGKWERRTSDRHYVLSLTPEGKGRLVIYEQAASATETFKYAITDKGVVVEWGKLKKETYHAVLTVDGKYLVLDDGNNVFVYKKREK